MRPLMTAGVSRANFQQEVDLALWVTPTTLPLAQKVVDWYCNYFDLPKVGVMAGRGKIRLGVYISAVSFCYRGGVPVIRIDKGGRVLAVPIHEVAHHYEYVVMKRGGHDPMFKRVHGLMLSKVPQMRQEVGI